MATTVPNNPYDVQPPAPKSNGIVGGAVNNVDMGTSAAAQELAKYNPMSGMSVQSYTPQTREVDRTTETAAGQVESLLAKDNPLMQRARTLALQNMNQRGLVNSSMAQGAGVAAMVDRITPIAQQDAQTYSNRSLANMEATNEAGQFNVGQNNQLFSQGLGIAANARSQEEQQTFQAGQAALDREQQTKIQTAQFDFQKAQADLDRAFQTAQQDKSIKAQMDLQVAQQNFTKAQNELDRAQQATLSQAQIASNERLTMAQIDATARNLNTQNQAQMEQMKLQIATNQTEAGKAYASNLAAQANAQINALLSDGNLDAPAKQAAIDNVIKNTNASLQWASTFYNTTLPAYTAPGGAQTNITPANKFSQAQANEALRGLVTIEPNATYQDVVKAGLNQGYTLDQINTAFDAVGVSKSGVIGRAAAPAPAPARAPAPAPAPAPVSNPAQVAEAWQRGDIGAVNNAIRSSGLTSRDVQQMYGLTDADINWMKRSGVAFA